MYIFCFILLDGSCMNKDGDVDCTCMEGYMPSPIFKEIEPTYPILTHRMILLDF